MALRNDAEGSEYIKSKSIDLRHFHPALVCWKSKDVCYVKLYASL